MIKFVSFHAHFFQKAEIIFILPDMESFLPLPVHRDASLISRHCYSMTVARRMPVRASTADHPPGVSRKKPRGIIPRGALHVHIKACTPSIYFTTSHPAILQSPAVPFYSRLSCCFTVYDCMVDIQPTANRYLS